MTYKLQKITSCLLEKHGDCCKVDHTEDLTILNKSWLFFPFQLFWTHRKNSSSQLHSWSYWRLAGKSQNHRDHWNSLQNQGRYIQVRFISVWHIIRHYSELCCIFTMHSIILENGGPNQGTESKTCTNTAHAHLCLICPTTILIGPFQSTAWNTVVTPRRVSRLIAPGAVPRCMNLWRTEA